ncbi:MAG: type II toxin-antitoxin system RelE/ParE family toxin [Brumimicrobium sp.]
MEIIWTDFAISNLKTIYDYFLEKANRKVANKIRNNIFKETNQLIKHPESGQVESNLNSLKHEYRYLVSGNYKIIYRIDGKRILINDVFDTRQHPDKMKKGK